MTKENTNGKEKWQPRTEQDMDQGFAWIVLIGCFFMFMFALGTMKSFGVLYTEMVEHFSSGSGNTAWIGSIAWFLLDALGPVANLLSKRFSFRRVTLAGGIMVGLGYFFSGFVTKMEQMYLTFTLCGIGYGLTNTPCVTIINYYFTKRRGLANGILMSASSIGALCFPFLYRFLIDKYGLLPALWVIGAMVFNICVAGCVFRQPVQLKNTRKLDESKNDTHTEDYEQSSDNTIATENRAGNKNPKNSKTCCSCQEIVLRVSILKNSRFAMYLIAFAFSAFGHVNNTILIPAHVKALGYDKTYEALSVSITGGVEIIARIFFGWFADLNIVSRKYIFVVCMFIGGIFSIITPLFESFTYMAIYAAASATFPASFFSLISILTIEVVGMDNFPNAIGLVALSMALASIINQPICGWMEDYYGNWYPAFILTGTTSLCAGVTVLLEPVITRCHTRKKTKVTDNEFATISIAGHEKPKTLNNDGISIVVDNDNVLKGHILNKYINPAFRNDIEIR